MIKTVVVEVTKVIIKKIGANFCQVDKRRQENHPKPAITLGNQKWKGNTPIFNINPIDNKVDLIKADLKLSTIISQERLSLKVRSLPNIKNLDPSAWITKYFTADSLSSILFW